MDLKAVVATNLASGLFVQTDYSGIGGPEEVLYQIARGLAPQAGPNFASLMTMDRASEINKQR
eukprot:733980-Alexandrium_andersonii.AAC.1